MHPTTKTICKLANTHESQLLCNQLVTQQGRSRLQLDQGYQRTQVQYSKLKRLLIGQGDRQVSVPEIYDQAIEKGLVTVPWRARSAQSVPGLSKEIARRIQRARKHPVRLAARLFKDLMRPRAQGGYGLQFDKSFTGPPRTLAQIDGDRKANCLEFVNFFIWIADQAGIPVVPLELLRSASGHSQQHVLIGIKDSSSGKILRSADIQTGRFAIPRQGEVLSPLSRRELLAYFYLNLGVGKEVKSGNRVAAERDVDRALQLSPTNYLLLYHKGYYRYKARDYAAATRYLSDSLQSNTNFASTYQALIEVGRATGNASLVRQQRYNHARIKRKGLLFY